MHALSGWDVVRHAEKGERWPGSLWSVAVVARWSSDDTGGKYPRISAFNNQWDALGQVRYSKVYTTDRAQGTCENGKRWPATLFWARRRLGPHPCPARNPKPARNPQPARNPKPGA